MVNESLFNKGLLSNVYVSLLSLTNNKMAHLQNKWSKDTEYKVTSEQWETMWTPSPCTSRSLNIQFQAYKVLY